MINDNELQLYIDDNITRSHHMYKDNEPLEPYAQIVETGIGYDYPRSSKTCQECGNVNKLLSLNDREWVCTECGSILDRNYNASLNLRDTENYVIYKAN